MANTSPPLESVSGATVKQGISQEVVNQLSYDINIMLTHASRNGIMINTDVNSLIENSSVNDLILAYNLLCKNVAPATPKSIEYTQEIINKGKSNSNFNKIPLVRNLILIALFFLFSYVLLGYSTDVNNKVLDGGVLTNSGAPLLIYLGYLTSISGLGVLFYLLKTTRTSIVKNTLIPEESFNYFSQIILGVIGGLFISEIISIYAFSGDNSLFNKSALALLGGFSSDAIFSVLKGLIDRLKSLFIPGENSSGQ